MGVLGLEDDVRDLKEIKRAYARAIKEFRPQTHPEEFRIRRDAYEAIQKIIQHEKEAEEVSEQQENAGNEIGDHSMPIEESRHLRVDQERLEIADEDALKQQKRPVNRNPQQVIPTINKEFLSTEMSISCWQKIIFSESDEDPEIIARYVGNAEMFHELDCDHNEITFIILAHRVDSENYEDLQEFALQWLAVKDRTAFLNAGSLTMYLVAELALVDFKLALRLYEEGYDDLHNQDRDSWMMHRVEQFLSAGRETQYYSITLKKIIAKMIRRSEWDGDAEEVLNRDIIERVAYLNMDSALRALLQAAVPSLVDVSDECARDGSTIVNNPTFTYTKNASKRKPAGSHSAASPWWAFLMVIFLISQIARCGSSTGSYNSYGNRNIPQFDASDFQDYRDLVNELERKNTDGNKKVYGEAYKAIIKKKRGETGE